MLKKLNIIQYVLMGICLLIILPVGFIKGFDTPETFITVLCCVLLGCPLIYLIMMLFRETFVLEYDTPRMMPFCMVSIILLGCLIWYLFFHVEHVFANSIGLWYGAVLLALAIPYMIMKLIDFILSKKKNKNNNGPKFIKNK